MKTYNVVIKASFESEALTFAEVKAGLLETLRCTFLDDIKIVDDVEINEANDDFTAFGFGICDVIDYAKDEMSDEDENGYDISEEEAKQILDTMLSDCDMQVGVNWYTLETFIREFIDKRDS